MTHSTTRTRQLPLIKQCRSCLEWKSATEYHKTPARAADGLQYHCKSCNAVRMREYRKRNPDKIRQRNRSHYERNADTVKEQARQWYENNPERVLERNREWRKQNPEAKQAQHQKRRSLQRRPESKGVSKEEWGIILDTYGHRCLACGKTGKMSMDHIVPLSLGGLHEPSNIQPLCRSCNSKKHDKIIDYRPAK